MNLRTVGTILSLAVLAACGPGSGSDADGDASGEAVDEAGETPEVEEDVPDVVDALETADEPDGEAADVEESTDEAGAEDAPDVTDVVVECPVDPGTYRVVGTWTDVSHDLAYVAGRVFAADSASNRVVAFDVETDAPVGEVAAGPGPYHLAVGAGLVFALDTFAETAPDDLVTVIDPLGLTRVAGVPIPTVGGEEANFPGDIGFYEDVVYVSNFTFSTPSVFPIDLSTFVCRPGWPAGSGPGGIAGSNGSLFVINGRSILDDSDDAVLVYTPGGVLLQTIETGGALRDIMTGGDGRVFVTRSRTEPGASRLLAIEPASYAVEELLVGELPNGLAVWEDLVFTANKGGPSVTVVDTAADDATREIDLRTVDPPLVNLRGIAAAPCGKLYLEADGMIAVYPEAY